MMKKRGFTLVELLVVIGIIAILVAVLTGLFAGATESARAVKCMANMRQLATVAYDLGNETYAGSSANTHKVFGGKVKATGARTGWLGWDNRASKDTMGASESMCVSTYCKDHELRRYCYKSGTFYSKVNGSIDVFRCPTHLAKMKKMDPAWSYVMNARLGWAFGSKKFHFSNKSSSPYDRTLVFAELPFLGTEGEVDTSESPGFKNDCTLQYDGCSSKANPEYIGFNHRTSKRMVCAHVAFADAHVEKLMWPYEKGLTKDELLELTKWLCLSRSISFDGKKYELIEAADKKK